MLKISVHPLLHFRGVKPSVKYLQKQGLPYHTARHIFADHMCYFNLSTIEKLCTALHCTPNDLIFYTPSKETVPPDHPLHTLNLERFRDEINEGLQQLDANEVELEKEQVRSLLEKKKNKQE
jgi:DNA-binding Xre family transcriptional regulator